MTGWFTNWVGVLPGRGDGSFDEATYYTVNGHPDAIAAGDLNGDSKDDMVVHTMEWPF